MARANEIVVRGSRYLIETTDEGRLEVRCSERERSMGSLLMRDGRVWGLLGGDYDLTREIVAKVRERNLSI